MPTPTTPPTVLQLIHARLADKSSRPGQRSDPYTLAMLLEGGGNAGAISGAMGTALEVSGALRVFDQIRGSSAGLSVGAYFAGGNLKEGVTIFPTFNCDNRFINPWRIFSGKPIMDLTYIIEDCFGKHRPMRWDAIRKSAIPVWAVASNRHGECVYLPLHQQPLQKQQEHTRLTSLVPLIAQGWNTHKDSIVDGMLTANIPFHVPNSSEDIWTSPAPATHNLILRTTPLGRWSFRRPLWEYPVLAIMRLIDPQLARLMKNRSTHILENYKVMQHNPPNILSLGLTQPGISAATRHAPAIWHAMGEAYLAAFQQLGLPRQPYPANWQAGLAHMPINA